MAIHLPWMKKKLKTPHHFKSVSCILLIKHTRPGIVGTRDSAVKKYELLKVTEHELGSQSLQSNNLFTHLHRKTMISLHGKTSQAVVQCFEMSLTICLNV